MWVSCHAYHVDVHDMTCGCHVYKHMYTCFPGKVSDAFIFCTAFVKQGMLRTL